MKTVLAIVTALALSATAYAAEQPGMGSGSSARDETFMQLDKNHDGTIDRAEAKADPALAKAFDTVAKNGKVNKQEFQSWEHSQHMGQHMGQQQKG